MYLSLVYFERTIQRTIQRTIMFKGCLNMKGSLEFLLFRLNQSRS